ncbi:MAG TPA: hypothetical protein VER33_16625 [Polyangiaceae bacterium]|nr:hypothetical protein [Polyangiaceae bacterium]
MAQRARRIFQVLTRRVRTLCRVCAFARKVSNTACASPSTTTATPIPWEASPDSCSGAPLGLQGIAGRGLQDLELRHVSDTIARDLAAASTGAPIETSRYRPW